MATSAIMEGFGFERAVAVNTERRNMPEGQAIVLDQTRDFNIDAVYFCKDKDESYPAVFLKKVAAFDSEALKGIAGALRKIWNYKKVLLLYAYSDTEIRIYNCAERPLIETEETNYEEELLSYQLDHAKTSDVYKLSAVQKIFSFFAIDAGIIWTIEEASAIRQKINLQRRVDRYLISSLITTARRLRSQGLKIELIHKIIMRSLFLLYLEDRQATDAAFYGKIMPGAKSYFDILNDVQATYALYQKLEEHFNGSLFGVDTDETITTSQLQLIKECFISGTDSTQQLKLFANWRLFDFSIIQIELLSEIYENFLLEIEPEEKDKTGAFYTPPSLVALILNEKLPITNKEKQYELRILDPACGSGIFLVEAFKRLVKRYENAHNQKLTDFNRLKQLLIDNIHGIEIHPQSIKVAAFSLYLALLDNLHPRTLWQNRKLPNLISDPEDKSLKAQGKNLRRRDAILEDTQLKMRSFDLVVGNPPFGTRHLTKSILDYCKTKGFAKEMVLPFLHKAADLAPHGQVALIFNTKILTNNGSTYQTFRKWLFNECYVEKIFNFSILRNVPEGFGGQLFGSATGPISIIFYQKENPKNTSERIIYYAPKTFVKSNILEGVIIDSTDLKYLPREECKKPDTKIWKIAMWGGMENYKIINRILLKTISFGNYFKNHSARWYTPRVGLNGDNEHQDFVPDTIIDPAKVERYYTSKWATFKNSKRFRQIDPKVFKPPFVIMKKGQTSKKISASYIDYQSFCTTACYVFNGPATVEEKKVLTAIFNSSFATYFLFMTAASWGIEREQIFKEEVLDMPALLSLMNAETIKKISILMDKIIQIKKNPAQNSDTVGFERQIDDIIAKDVLGLTSKDMAIIADTLRYNLDLFENREKSIALQPTKTTTVYAKALCNELNSFLRRKELFASTVSFKPDKFSPLAMVKLIFSDTANEQPITHSTENIVNELKSIDKALWHKTATSLYFRKKLNYYYAADTIYLIRPNQQRFWNETMGREDAAELILEILDRH